MTAQSSGLRRFGFLFLSLLFPICALLLITSLTMATPAQSAATIIVNPGDSIQAAIDAATLGDTILINPGTYTESLTLNKAVSLTGVNSETVIIKALPDQRVLTVTGSAVSHSVAISGFTLSKGNATGGVTRDSCPAACGGGLLITNTAQPLLQDLIITGNSASAMGGGLYTDDPLTLTHVAFLSNSVKFEGGGAYIGGAATIDHSRFEENACTSVSDACSGGGLLAAKTVNLHNSYFISNTVAGGAGGGGGGVYAFRAATVADSLFEGNRCSDCLGGGLFAFTTLTATNTVFKDNEAYGSGGGAHAVDGAALVRSRFENNRVTWFLSFGGGLASEGWLKATDTVFISNVSSNLGGGLSVYALSTINGGAFTGNQSNHGAGLSAGRLFLTGTTFINNVAQDRGGGADIHEGRIVNAAFADNRAGNRGAAVYLDVSDQADILYTTIADSKLNPKSAIAVAANFDNGAIGITNTIIASHTIGIEQAGDTVYQDYNLLFGNTTNLSGAVSGGAHDVYGNPNFVDPVLDNYHIISPSAAIDAGVNAGVTTDLDGIPRPVGAGYDIGAYEYNNFTSYVFLPLVQK